MPDSPFDIVGDPNTGGMSPVGGSDIMSLFLAAQGGPLGLGLGVGSKLFSLISGMGKAKKKKRLFNDINAILAEANKKRGKPVFDTEDIYAKTVVGANPALERKGREFDTRFGFDSGRAGKEMSALLAEFFGELRPGLETRNAQLSSERDLYLANLGLQGKNIQAGLI